MSIASLKKVTIAGRVQDKTAALEGLQALGCIHLIPLRPEPPEPEKAPQRDSQAALKALRFLTGVPTPRLQVRRAPNFDVDEFVQITLDLQQRTREANDRRDFLEARIAAVKPWGHIAFPALPDLADQRLWFYELPLKERAALENPALPPWQVVATDNRFAYVVLVASEEPPADLLPVPRIHVGDTPLSDLERQLEEVAIELETLAGERVALTRFLSLLRANLSDAATHAERAFAEQQTLDDPDLFVIQGWVPDDRLDDLTARADSLDLALLAEPPERGETPPTLLRQEPERQAGVDLAMFYQVPNYRAWDPSLILVASFALFFAMIIADAGYGGVLLLGVAGFWTRLGSSAAVRSWRLLGLVLALATTAYGMLVGSYFGISVSASSPLSTFKVLDLEDFDSMMRLSITVGVLHLALAIGLAAWAGRHRTTAYASVGWIGVIVGGFLIWVSGQQGPWTVIGGGLMVAGFAAIVAFSSDRAIAKPIDLVMRLLAGLQALAGAMGAFGDVLSYMRLFALGLASASLALTFNDLAVQVMQAAPGIGILAGLLILIVGHVLNFGLALMSGVVHGLRLNYIEFYKWGLPDEGIAFRPFARKEVR